MCLNEQQKKLHCNELTLICSEYMLFPLQIMHRMKAFIQQKKNWPEFT